MFPYWDDVIAPVIESVEAQRIVEIGALRGDTTVRMLDRLGPTSELHVIDPVPQFDPAEHERRFPGRYIFHHGISHDVLPTLPPADVALIDGDHNWFTVHRELQMLAATSRAAGVALPVLVLHDVGWPYGRRDLYYEPSRIPDEHRQPHRRAGMQPGMPELRPRGGMNVDLHNAEREGGPHNGVLTALEDFISEHDQPVRCVVLPPYFGLAIVAEEQQLDDHPALRALLDRLDTVDGQRGLVVLGEKIRIREAITTQAFLRYHEQRFERSASRYLGVVKAALLDLHYIDNEVRLDHLGRLLGQSNPDLSLLRDPVRQLSAQHQRISQARAAGRSFDAGSNVAFFPYTDMGRAQLDALETALDHVRLAPVVGDVMEVGVGRGGGAIFMRAYLDAHEMTGRQVWVVDELRATRRDGDGDDQTPLGQAAAHFAADLHQVRDGFDRFDVLDDQVRIAQGVPPEVVEQTGDGPLALVRFGRGLGPALVPTLRALHHRLTSGAVVIVSDTADPAVEGALEDVAAVLGPRANRERIDWNSVRWTVPDPTPEPVADESANRVEGQPHLQPPAQVEPVDLSVVVVFYNMAREAPRTLQSLTRSYQRNLEDLSYEVIVVDNGSDLSHRLTAEAVASYGPEFHLLDLGHTNDSSPVRALNAGIALARGGHMALMIDGAHVLTPGVLHHGMVALTAYAPAVVATQQWYLGPGQQNETLTAGYDQRVEDRLFQRIEWPVDGYRLFEIGHFIGERDWFDGIVESNCIFMPRKLLEQVGGVDERFAMAGGGYANLDLFERLALAPGVTAASILGEGSFHQFHGGTTTNVADGDEQRELVASYRQHFSELRGRPLLQLDRPIKFVGALAPSAAKRTRARRPFGAIDALREPMDHGAGAPPALVADELKIAAIEALWDNRAWTESTWLGHRVNRFPTDLHTYQELLSERRPAVVVVAGDDDGVGGRGLFAATILDQLGDGRVITVGRGDVADRPLHPRLAHVAGPPEEETVAAEVLDLAGEGDAMVFIALGQDRRVVQAFERYSPLVAVGGYVIIENTVVNGRPAAPGFGPGPLEAVFQILATHPEFTSDRLPERYTVTFNRDGYLRRLGDR